MKITNCLTEYNHKKGRTDSIKYIVIHYVGATGSAKANCEYYKTDGVGASAHYFVDFNGDVWRSVRDEDTAWHCGASTYKHPECRNANSIGIEMCVRNNGSKANTSRDWYFEEETVESSVELTKELMRKYNIDADNVIRHYDVTGKICPNPYVYNHTRHTWDGFKELLKTDDGIWVQLSDGTWVWRYDNGELAEGWKEIHGHKFYFKNHIALSGYQVIDGKRYYFETEGKYECCMMVTNEEGAFVVYEKGV